MSKAVLAAALAGSVVITAATPPQAAQTPRYLAQLMNYGSVTRKVFACFGRTYDDAHLAAHTQQKVRAYRILAMTYPYARYDGSPPFGLQLRMEFEFRDRPEILTTVAECDGTGKPCAGPSEKGHTTLSIAGKRTVSVALPDQIHLWQPGPHRPEDTVNDAFGPDDRRFRLDRIPLSNCSSQFFPDELKEIVDRHR